MRMFRWLLAMATALSPVCFLSAQESESVEADESAPVLRYSSRHESMITTVEVSSDGRFIFSATPFDTEIKIWDTRTGKEIKSLKTDGPVKSINWRPMLETYVVFTTESQRLIDPKTLEWERDSKGKLKGRKTRNQSGARVVHDPFWKQSFTIQDGFVSQRVEGKIRGRELINEKATYQFEGLDDKLHGSDFDVLSVVPFDFDQVIMVREGEQPGMVSYNTDFGEFGRFVPLQKEPVEVFDFGEFHFLVVVREKVEDAYTFEALAYDKESLEVVDQLKLPFDLKRVISKIVAPTGQRPDDSVFRFLGKHRIGYALKFEDKKLLLEEMGSFPDGESLGINLNDIRTFNPLPHDPSRIILGGNGTRGHLVEWDTMDTVEPLKLIGDARPIYTRIEVNPRRDEFMVFGEGGAKRVQFSSGQLLVEPMPSWAQAIYSPDGRQILYYSLEGSFTTGFLKTASIAADGTLVPQAGQGVFSSIKPLTFSEDKSLAATFNSTTVSFHPVEGEPMNRSSEIRVGDFLAKHSDRNDLIAISPDKRYLAVFATEKAPMTSVQVRQVKLIEIATGQTVWEKPTWEYEAIGLQFFGNDRVGFYGPQKEDPSFDFNHYRIFDVESGNEITAGRGASIEVPHQRKTDFDAKEAVAVNRDKDRIAVTGGSGLHVYDLLSGERLLRGSSGGARFVDVGFFANSNYLVAAAEDGKIYVWDTTKETVMAEIGLFTQDSEWVINTPDFRFDASNRGAERLYFVNNTDVIPIEQLYDQYYTPQLWDSLLSGDELSPLLPPAALQSPPEVELAFYDSEGKEVSAVSGEEALTVKVRATSTFGKIADLRLYHNGKVVSGLQRGLIVVDDEPDEVVAEIVDELDRNYAVGLLPGVNEFKAVALNAQRIESVPVEVNIAYQGASKGGMRLHIFVVGINEYQNSRYNLNYAEADATAFLKAIEESSRGVYSDISVTKLLNEEASRENIIKAFESIQAASGARDVLVFYYAGHGVMSQEAEPEFFLVPPDVTQLYGNDDLLRRRGVAASELNAFAADIPAQKQLFVLDACQSAGALEAVAMRGAATEKAIARLARSTGTHWLTASGSEQFAAEFETLGHGLFTYAILEALNGEADNGDAQVTVRELDAYLQRVVPQLSRKHRGSAQYPASYGYGQDFPISITR